MQFRRKREKRPPISGIRSIDIETTSVDRAVNFYRGVWGLEPITTEHRSVYLRGAGRYNYILAIHKSGDAPALRRVTFDAPDRRSVQTLFEAVKASGCTCEEPHELGQPGGGYGFGFMDVEDRNLAVVSEVKDHPATRAVHPDKPRKIAHVNFNAVDVAGTNRFLIEVLGFRLIDETPALFFFHANNTDHNSVVVCKGAAPTLNHVAYDMPDLDSVMRGAGRMRDNGYPIEWGVGRHGAGNNVFAYFAGPDEFPIEYTGEVLQIDASYQPRGPDQWRFPPGRMDQWGVTNPHTTRWKRIQDLIRFAPGAYRLQAR
jgi:catechol 2,3-dioxygenase-like lactoylglutathione lyase family enzyme